jgi:hypothetical protein
MKAKQLTKAPCNRCNRETKHAVLKKRLTSDEADAKGYGPVSWQDVYEMLECGGCESVTLRHTHLFSEYPEPRVSYYPPPIARPAPMWKHKLPLELRSLADEVYSALHADSRRLGLMGARTILDMVLLEKVGDAGTFLEKLKKFEDLGFVGSRDREILEAALDAGSAAAHRGYRPKPDQLDQVMDIVEHLLEAVYVLHRAAADLRKSTPPRKRATSS